MADRVSPSLVAMSHTRLLLSFTINIFELNAFISTLYFNASHVSIRIKIFTRLAKV